MTASDCQSSGPPTVLVLGADSRMVLPILRSLGRKGIRCEVAWTDVSREPLSRSRYLAQAHSLDIGSPNWKNDLRELLVSKQFQLVIPATEDAVYLLQHHRVEFESLAPIYLLGDRAFEACFDKRRTYELAESLAIPIPRTIDCETSDDLLMTLDMPLPAIVKPRSSVRAADLQKNFVCKVDDRDALLSYVELLVQQGCGALVQEYFPGTGVGVELIADRGKVLFAFQHERLHETTGLGSTYRKGVDLDPALCDAATRLMAELEYTGVAMVEFRVNKQTGQWRLMEINARFWGSLPLAVKSGADFPYYLYTLLLQGPQATAPKCRIGIHCRSFGEDLIWWWKTLIAQRSPTDAHGDGALAWAVQPVPRSQMARDLLRRMSFRDAVDTFAWDDPRPYFSELGAYLRRAYVRMFALRPSATMP